MPCYARYHIHNYPFNWFQGTLKCWLGVFSCNFFFLFPLCAKQDVTARVFMPLFECPSRRCSVNRKKGNLILQLRASKFLKFQEVIVQHGFLKIIAMNYSALFVMCNIKISRPRFKSWRSMFPKATFPGL